MVIAPYGAQHTVWAAGATSGKPVAAVEGAFVVFTDRADACMLVHES